MILFRMILGPRFCALALVLALVGSLQVCLAGKNSDKEYPLETYVKNYELINDHLERRISSNDLRSNFAVANHWLAKERSKLSIRRNRSLEKALERFLMLSKDITSTKMCYDTFKIVKSNEEALANEERLSDSNYQMRRIDKIIEQVAYNYLDLCRSMPGDIHELKFSFKMRSFDEINLLLLEKKPKNTDPRKNMAKNFELLRETADGALYDGLRLLSSLKSAVEDKLCNEDEFMVVLKNLVGSRQSIAIRGKRREIVDSMRRIDRLVLHYAYDYMDSCLDSFPEQFKVILKRLNELTSKRLRLLASELAIGHHETTEATETQCQSEFTTPELVEYTMNKPQNAPSSSWELNIIGASGDDLRRYLKELAAPRDPDARYLETFMDEVRGESCVDLAKVASLYDKYIVVTCRNYTEITRRFFERFRFHIYHSAKGSSPLQKDQVGLGLGLAVYDLCENLIRERRVKVYAIANSAKSDKHAILINDDF